MLDYFTSWRKRNHREEIKKRIAIAAVNANTGTYHIWDETTDNVVKAVASSASVPGIFPP